MRIRSKLNIAEVGYLFLRDFQAKISYKMVEDYLRDHLYFNSILSLSDLFSEMGFKTEFIRVSNEKLNLINGRFITLLKTNIEDNNEFVIVDKINENSVFIINKQNRLKEISISEFVKRWNNVVLLIQKSESQYINFSVNSYLNTNINISSLVLKILFGTTLLMILSELLFNNLQLFIIQILNFLALFISFQLISLDLGYHNQITESFCNINDTVNCNSVLSSNGASIFNIKWSVIGFSFFLTSFILNQISSFLDYNKQFLVAPYIVFLSIPFILYAIFYQWIILKKWCPFCITIHLILGIQILLTILFFPITLYVLLSFKQILFFILLFLLISLVLNFWLLPTLILNKDLKNRVLLFRKASLDTTFFNNFLLLQKKTINDGTFSKIGILIGEITAKHEITCIFNPYCLSCFISQKNALRLLRVRKKVKLNIIFVSAYESKKPTNSVINYLLNINFYRGAEEIFNALFFWMSLKKMDYQLLVEKFPLKETLIDFNYEIQKMHIWCEKNNLFDTPNFFINGYLLPKFFDIYDLKYLL